MIVFRGKLVHSWFSLCVVSGGFWKSINYCHGESLISLTHFTCVAVVWQSMLGLLTS